MRTVSSDSRQRTKTIGALTWFELNTPSQALLNSLTSQLQRSAFVVEVEMPLGMRGEELSAESWLISAKGEVGEQRDLTEDAQELLYDGIEEPDQGFDEDVAASELAWTFAEELSRFD